MFRYQDKGFKVFKTFIIVFLIFNITLISLGFGLMMQTYKMEKYIENKPEDVSISGIKSFSLQPNDQIEFEYNPSYDNFGQTGDLLLNCYKGVCQKEYYYDDYDYDDYDDYDYDDYDYDDYDYDDYDYDDYDYDDMIMITITITIMIMITIMTIMIMTILWLIIKMSLQA